MDSLRWGSPIFEWLSIRSHCLMTWMIWGTITLEPVDTGSTWPCGLGASDHHLDHLVQINPEMGKRKEITTVLVGFYQFISCRICWMDLENIGYEARRSHRKSGFETDVIPVFPYVYIYICVDAHWVRVPGTCRVQTADIPQLWTDSRLAWWLS